MLTNEQIHFLFDRLGPAVVRPSKDFPYTVLAPRRMGYSDDPMIGAIEAALSIMLEMNGKRVGR